MVDFKIGFIGIGTMGEHMCRNIMKKGSWSMYVYDINKSQVNKMVSEGAKACDTLQEIAKKCNIIISMVPTNDNVKLQLHLDYEQFLQHTMAFARVHYTYLPTIVTVALVDQKN